MQITQSLIQYEILHDAELSQACIVLLWEFLPGHCQASEVELPGQSQFYPWIH